MPYLRSKWLTPSTFMIAAIFWATVSGQPT
ncbi:MAG: hypothetical protein JWR81_3176 [Pseudonocardia sp.]|jgi:hypothetical protein|nr:hypothetical protein [Pseudonocardia sp.]